MSEVNTNNARVDGFQSFDFIVALAFPPHPSAVAPSAELGAHAGLSPRDRAEVNKYWGGVKLAHSRLKK